MEVKTKIKKKLKKEYEIELQEIYPNAFETVKNTVRIKPDNNPFCKLMQTNPQYQKIILDKLGVTYLGYLNLLLNSLTYENIVHFDHLGDLGIKEGMIKICKKKMIEAGIVKKYRGDFYLNPAIAIKGETINPDLMKLFE